MVKNLVIVESPAKAKTIERYLGQGWKVVASYGHVRDLPKSDFAVEREDGSCHLVYEVPSNAKKQVTALRREAKDAERVWLAPDLDREGEAIAWHVAELLGLDDDEANRVTFDEITRDAILAAFEEPRQLNHDLVDAQQARRAVDRIVGYRLSPVLWRTVSSGISAGRVQSVALRIIVDREEEIRAFVPREYWSLHATFAHADGGEDAPSITASLHSVGGRRVATPRDLEDADDDKLRDLLVVGDEGAATDLRDRAEALDYGVREVRRNEARRNPPPPFKTSTLQGQAASRLGFSSRQTMQVAQQLYEGIDLGGRDGAVGLITYMRTDSVNLSDQALSELTAFVGEHYGQAYGLDKPRRYRQDAQRAQEAHEAVRPTAAGRTPQSVRQHLTSEQFRLYELIWKRTVATQMAPAVFDRVSADVVGVEDDGTEFLFRVTGQVLKFDGYLKVWGVGGDDEDDEEESSEQLPELEEGETLDLSDLEAEQHFTQPPPRYTERRLIETLEAEGIGRPSTYASIISTLREREYVRVEQRRFTPTPLGEVVVSFLKAHFYEVVDVGFTARMEETLDVIAAGEQHWCQTVNTFLDEVDEWVRERKPERPRLPLTHPADCPQCGEPMEKVFSGKSKQWFASCSRWPDCDGTLPLDEEGRVTEPEPEPEPDERVRCPSCGKAMLLREGRYGPFYGCPDYPKCKGIRNVQQRVMVDPDGNVPFACPKDGGYLELRKSRYGKPFVGCVNYPDCDYAVWSVPVAQPCPQCSAPMKPPPRNRKVPVSVCTNEECGHKIEVDDFEVERVRTLEVVQGVPGLDPDAAAEPAAAAE